MEKVIGGSKNILMGHKFRLEEEMLTVLENKSFFKKIYYPKILKCNSCYHENDRNMMIKKAMKQRTIIDSLNKPKIHSAPGYCLKFDLQVIR